MNILLYRFYKRLAGRANIGTYVVSYPKTGRTWLRTLIGKYLLLKHGFPDKYLLHTALVTGAGGLPPVKFTHAGSDLNRRVEADMLSVDTEAFHGARVILLSRDVRDTLVSAYFHVTRRERAFDGSISEFVRDTRFGVRKILSFYRNWFETAHAYSDFFVLTYESLKQRPNKTLENVLRYVGEENISSANVEKSVEFAQFDNMRAMEARNSFVKNMLRPKDVRDDESYKVRKGIVGGYSAYLSEEDERFIQKELARHGFNSPDLRG